MSLQVSDVHMRHARASLTQSLSIDCAGVISALRRRCRIASLLVTFWQLPYDMTALPSLKVARENSACLG